VFSSYLLNSWRCQKLYSIDPWSEQKDYADLANVSQTQHDDAFQICRKKLKRFGDRSEIIRTFSHEAVRCFADGSLDFVYLDARHDYLSIKEDIELWYRKLKKGGILAGHDYLDGVIANTYFGVKQAVNEKFTNVHRTLEIDVLYPSWWIVV
jgi:predicted O-methyltransferase YrrM